MIDLNNLKEQVNLDIERLAKDPNTTYLDAIIFYCEQNDVDVEEIRHILSKHILDKLESELIESRVLKAPKIKKIM